MATDTFTPLLKLLSAAEACWGQSRTFVERFNHPPNYSRARDLATKQARDQLAWAHIHLRKIDEAVKAWDTANERGTIELVNEAVGIAAPPFYIDGLSYQTAHEAGRWYAALAHNTAFRLLPSKARDYDPAALVDELAEHLRAIPEIADQWGRLQSEHYAASQLATTSDDGPQPPDKFVWRGKTFKIAGLPWKLLNALWWSPGRTAIDANLLDQVYGQGEGDHGKLKTSVAAQLSRQLNRTETGVSIHCKGERFWISLPE